MIVADPTDPVRTPSAVAETWRDTMRDAIRDPIELCRSLQLPPDFEPAAIRASRRFPLFVPRPYLRRIRPRDIHDPLLRQVLPLEDELADVPGFTQDPVGDMLAKQESGILQKYQARVLVIATGACGINCRYCFRRHFPYAEIPKLSRDTMKWVEEIRRDSSIEEVILSGGDPLTLPDSQLATLMDKLSTITHVRRVRFHTRMPVVIPSRVTDELCRWMINDQFATVLVVQSNHPNEIDGQVEAVLARLARAGVLLLNQSVLLRGVNDNADTLAKLSRRLLDCRVVPYYLHQLDRVAGAAHFEVPLERGIQLVQQLRVRMAGYGVPRFAREVAGQTSKEVLA
jgi:L-lysine 2,3-aminomutase